MITSSNTILGLSGAGALGGRLVRPDRATPT
jgi:hypothetical protein